MKDETLISTLLGIFLIFMIFVIIKIDRTKQLLQSTFETFTNFNNTFTNTFTNNLTNNNLQIETFEGNNNTNNPNLKVGEVPSVKFPFRNMFDEKGNKLNIILITAPFRGPDHDKLYLEYKNHQNPKLEFMGCSSYLEFPGKIKNPYENRYHEQQKHDYQSMVKTWLHCFRNPDNYLKPESILPRLLLSESDFKDFNAHKPNPSIKKEYDFIYVCLKDNDKCDAGWQSYNRNWELAKKCLIIMCKKFNLKGAIIGREGCDFTDLCSGIVKVLPFLKYHDFQKELQKAKFLFVPNVSDASPRVLTEALCYDLKLLVNYNILGGWKYVNEMTGEFFNDEFDIESSLNKLVKNLDNNKYQPRKFFVENYGKEKTGKKLADFIKMHYPNVNPIPNIATIAI